MPVGRLKPATIVALLDTGTRPSQQLSCSSVTGRVRDQSDWWPPSWCQRVAGGVVGSYMRMDIGGGR